MRRKQYRYLLEFFRDDSSPAGHVAITPDWGPAVEWAHFEGVRRGRLPAVSAAGTAEIDPVWHRTLGAPYLGGVRIALAAGDGGRETVAFRFATTYFRRLAEQASAELVEQGQLRSGEIFRYLVSAYAAPPAAAEPSPALDFSVVEEALPLALAETALASYLQRAALVDADSGPDVAVFVAQPVLDEAMALARAAGDVETGGVLVGRLHRDARIPDLFVEVTAQIAAPHTVSDSFKVTFTADTWAAVRAALALRRRQELMLGWWHYHPDFCRLRGCPLERRRTCTAASAFFSAEDVQLHHVVFARAFQVALLVSDSAADGLQASLFGWRNGVVAERGFHVLAAPHTGHPGVDDGSRHACT